MTMHIFLGSHIPVLKGVVVDIVVQYNFVAVDLVIFNYVLSVHSSHVLKKCSQITGQRRDFFLIHALPLAVDYQLTNWRAF